MNPLLLWTAIGSGLALLLVVLVTRRRLGGRHPEVRRGFLDVGVASVGTFLVLIGAALLAGDATRILVVWLVVVLAVALVCTVIRSASTRDEPPEDVQRRSDVLRGVTRVLARADYHQVSFVRLVVSLDDAALVTTAFGPGAGVVHRDRLVAALQRLVPPDATVWTEGDDRVVVLVRQEECDLAGWRAELEMPSTGDPADGATVGSSTTWAVTSTDDRGYRLEDLERP